MRLYRNILDISKEMEADNTVLIKASPIPWQEEELELLRISVKAYGALQTREITRAVGNGRTEEEIKKKVLEGTRLMWW